MLVAAKWQYLKRRFFHYNRALMEVLMYRYYFNAFCSVSLAFLQLLESAHAAASPEALVKLPKLMFSRMI